MATPHTGSRGVLPRLPDTHPPGPANEDPVEPGAGGRGGHPTHVSRPPPHRHGGPFLTQQPPSPPEMSIPPFIKCNYFYRAKGSFLTHSASSSLDGGLGVFDATLLDFRVRVSGACPSEGRMVSCGDPPPASDKGTLTLCPQRGGLERVEGRVTFSAVLAVWPTTDHPPAPPWSVVPSGAGARPPVSRSPAPPRSTSDVMRPSDPGFCSLLSCRL